MNQMLKKSVVLIIRSANKRYVYANIEKEKEKEKSLYTTILL